ncbi:MAG TPA: ankyrin repeat domain-containing protein [Tepidisphaeraceae bacterium]|nr:ankyrin repeat domain-containing protein [Tepidisphaeraceae bacterium]
MRSESKRCNWYDHFRPRAGEATIVMIVSLLVWGWTQCMAPPVPFGSALRNAAERGDVCAIERASLQELNRPDHTGTLPILAASRCGQAAVVEALLRRGIDPNTPLPLYGRPIIVAASMGCTEVVRVLLRHGATLDGRDNLGRDALTAAAEGVVPSCIRLLLDAGANLQNLDKEGFTAQQRAVEGANPECIKLLNSAAQHANRDALAMSENSIKN